MGPGTSSPESERRKVQERGAKRGVRVAGDTKVAMSHAALTRHCGRVGGGHPDELQRPTIPHDSVVVVNLVVDTGCLNFGRGEHA